MGGCVSFLLKGLEQEKPVIFCGDLNVAATEMDIKNAKANEKNAGFTKEEREKFAVIKEKALLIPSVCCIRTP